MTGFLPEWECTLFVLSKSLEEKFNRNDDSQALSGAPMLTFPPPKGYLTKDMLHHTIITKYGPKIKNFNFHNYFEVGVCFV